MQGDTTRGAEIQESLEACIQDCLDCERSCYDALSDLWSRAEAGGGLRNWSLLLDCAEICSTTAKFMSRGSEFHGYTCSICAQICDQCADFCEQFSGDEQMMACAEDCRTCAQSCREMASGMGIETRSMQTAGMRQTSGYQTGENYGQTSS